MKRLLILLSAALLFAGYAPRQDSSQLCYAHTDIEGGQDFVIYAAPQSDEILMTLPGKYDYDLILCSPQNGWWKLLSPVSIVGMPDDEDEEVDKMLPGEGWIPASSACFITVLRRSEPIIFRESPSESAAEVASVPPGDIWALHPLDLYGEDWVKVQQADFGPVGWIPGKFICVSNFEVCTEEGYYEDEDEDEDE